MEQLLTCLSTARNALCSPLLKLPAELRNQIYAEVIRETLYPFSRCCPHQRCCCYGIKESSLGFLSLRCIGLLITCRQITMEANLLQFELNCFGCFTSPSMLHKFLRKVSSRRQTVTSLRLMLDLSFSAWNTMYQWDKLAVILPGLERVEVELRKPRYGTTMLRFEGRKARVKEWLASESDWKLEVLLL